MRKASPIGVKPKKLTVSIVDGKIIKVWQTDIDRNGRIVGFVFAGDKNLNKELFSAGLAWHYKYYSCVPELAKLEFETNSSKRGLWAESELVPPWEWRRMKRQ